MARILVAEDNADQILMLRRLLETFGYQVGTARSPAEALAEFERNRPDLVVADLRIPNTSDGLALVRGVRERDPKLPLIVLSGWPDDLYGSPEESMVSRVVLKGTVQDLLKAIAELLA
ncbi:MAG TPA: response regulator [Bryobacteraceae bacterium]|nr:response regulator [Bryobacteraceae bacterium]